MTNRLCRRLTVALLFATLAVLGPLVRSRRTPQPAHGAQARFGLADLPS